MERSKAIELLKNAVPARGYEVGPFIEAVCMAISALEGKDINVPSNSALDHIHNVVAENERKRGYEQAKAEYDHKLTVIKGRIKDRYYNKGYSEGYEQGKADAAPKWVPFTAETAPKEDGLYIVKHKTKTGGKAISADSYSTAYGEWFINHNDAVIAWTPAPKEEGEQSGKAD